ncbi:MAG TPA: DUF1697 domain-containing protein [Alphaproteobacteria bacterium]|nr:DUF1697 domain-containing protein [Alphaproteobacteria bacterium]
MKNQYLALLRGINVGGNNIIKMADLKKSFEDMGFSDVATFIQSGNVIFSDSSKNTDSLTEKIEKALSKRFNYKSCVVLISHETLKKAVKLAPKDFGKYPDKYKYDVVFLKKPLTSANAMKEIKLKEGVDAAYAGKDVVYLSRLTAKASSSYINKIAMLLIYKQMTIRNWNSTTKLLALMDKRT